MTSLQKQALNAKIFPLNADAIQPGDKLSDGTIYVGQCSNGDYLFTLPGSLPKWESWNHAAKYASEEQMINQNINVHHLLKEQGVDDCGHTDWRLPTMRWEHNPKDDECWMLWSFSENEGRS